MRKTVGVVLVNVKLMMNNFEVDWNSHRLFDMDAWATLMFLLDSIYSM